MKKKKTNHFGIGLTLEFLVSICDEKNSVYVMPVIFYNLHCGGTIYSGWFQYWKTREWTVEDIGCELKQ